MEQNLKEVKMVMPLSQGLQSTSLLCPLGFTGPSLEIDRRVLRVPSGDR